MSMMEDSCDLFVAVREGNLGDVKKLIDIYGLSYFPAWQNGFRLLCEALESKQSEVAAFLLKSGAKIRNSKPLQLAVLNGDIAIAKKLLNHALYNDFDIDANDNHEKNYMFYAAQNADFPMFKLLIDHGAKVKHHTGLLSYACKYDCIEIVQYLLNKGMSANDKGETGKNAIWYAMDNLNLKMVRLLLAFNATLSENLRLIIVDWMESDQQIADALSTVVDEISGGSKAKFWRGLSKILGGIITEFLYFFRSFPILSSVRPKILRADPFDPHLDPPQGEIMMNKRISGDEMVEPHSTCKLLNAAVHEELITVVRSLLDDGADTNCETCNEMTPLSLAVYKKNKEITQMLLTSGANASSNAFSHAVETFQLPIVRLLLEHKADVNAKVQSRWSGLHYSIIYYSFHDNIGEMVNLLLQFGAEVNVRAPNGSTALYSACKAHREDIVRVLLRHGADVNIATDYGDTALFSVYRNRMCERDLGYIFVSYSSIERIYSNNNISYLKIIEMLLEHGADVNSRVDVSRNLLHLACDEIDIEMVKMLLRCGANVNITDANNQVPISTTIALSSSSYDIISCILTQEIVKLVSMGLKVHDQNLKAINSEKLIKLKVECEQEIALLKEDVFDEAFISFYDILIGCTNSVVGYLRNDAVMQVTSSQRYKSKYPIYADRIACQLEKALEMKELLEKASVILHGLARSQIPEDCIQRILKFLIVGDLKNLIEGQKMFFVF